MDYWKKTFCDGTSYVGTDKAVKNGVASWSKSRLDSMTSAEISCDQYLLVISGPGNYWQSDTFEATFPGGNKRVQRRIQKQIELLDRSYKLSLNSVMTKLEFSNTITSKCEIVYPEAVGQWMTLEYDYAQKAIRYYIAPSKL